MLLFSLPLHFWTDNTMLWFCYDTFFLFPYIKARESIQLIKGDYRVLPKPLPKLIAFVA